MATHPTAVRNGIVDYVVDLLDAGVGAGNLVLQTGAAAEVATLAFSDPAFGASAGGVATANAISDDASATGGTSTQFVAEDSDSNEVFSGSVSATGGGGEIELTSNIIPVGGTVQMTSFTYTGPS